MSRILKFRAWNKATKKMIDRVLVGCNKDDNSYVCNLVWSNTEEDWVNFDEFCGEIIQYSGFNDIKGKEIFEGDVFKSKGNTYLVVYRNGFMWRKIYDSWTERNVYKESKMSWLSHGDEYDVIGNIFDNPELKELC